MKFLNSQKETKRNSLENADWEELRVKKDTEDDIYIKGKCELLIKWKLQIEEQKKEYQAVLSYLNDIQKLRLIPAHSKKKLMDYAKQIETLTDERKRYQTGTHSFWEKQYQLFEEYNENMPKEIRSMCEKESYQKVLLKDMRQLEAEKEVIKYELTDIQEKKRQLKRTGVLCACLSGGAFFLFFLRSNTMQERLFLPILLTVFVAGGTALYMMNELIRLKKEYVYEDRKLEKAIALLNKVKIKYVNNEAALSSMYKKFSVHSSTRLTELWEEYNRIKDSKERYQKNTEYLNYYNECFIGEIRDFQVEDADIWSDQVAAFIDESKMDEIEQRLRQRRKNLQEAIQEAKEQEKKEIEEIRSIFKRRKEVQYILDKYDLTEQISLNSIDTI